MTNKRQILQQIKTSVNSKFCVYLAKHPISNFRREPEPMVILQSKHIHIQGIILQIASSKSGTEPLWKTKARLMYSSVGEVSGQRAFPDGQGEGCV